MNRDLAEERIKMESIDNIKGEPIEDSCLVSEDLESSHAHHRTDLNSPSTEELSCENQLNYKIKKEEQEQQTCGVEIVFHSKTPEDGIEVKRQAEIQESRFESTGSIENLISPKFVKNEEEFKLKEESIEIKSIQDEFVVEHSSGSVSDNQSIVIENNISAPILPASQRCKNEQRLQEHETEDCGGGWAARILPIAPEMMKSTYADGRVTHRCRICPFATTKPQPMRDHLFSHKPYKCLECSYVCLRPWELRTHMTTHPEEEPTHHSHQTKSFKHSAIQPTQLKCAVCSSVLSNHKDFIDHIARKHYVKKCHRCAACGFTCASDAQLDRHKTGMIPHGKSYRCAICLRIYHSLRSIQNHLARHPDLALTSLAIPICPFYKRHRISSEHAVDTARQSSQNNTVQNHAGIYRCAECSFTCDAQASRKHSCKSGRASVGTLAAKNTYKCMVCLYPFDQADQLDTHMEFHGGKSYGCTVCPFVCNRLVAFEQHMAEHALAKAFRCSICDYSCEDADTLRKHVSRHELRHCKLCPFTCFDSLDLSIHTVGHGFKCLECGFSCGDAQTLQDHAAVHPKSPPKGTRLRSDAIIPGRPRKSRKKTVYNLNNDQPPGTSCEPRQSDLARRDKSLKKITKKLNGNRQAVGSCETRKTDPARPGETLKKTTGKSNRQAGQWQETRKTDPTRRRAMR